MTPAASAVGATSVTVAAVVEAGAGGLKICNSHRMSVPALGWPSKWYDYSAYKTGGLAQTVWCGGSSGPNDGIG